MAVQPRQLSFSVKPDLLNVLKSAGADKEHFTIQEVLKHLRDYISDRVLYDLKEPRRILCENDQLEKAFGVKMFMLTEVPKLLYNNLIPVPSPVGNAGEGTAALSAIEKRKLETDNQLEDDYKRQRGEHSAHTSKRRSSPWFMYICPTPEYDSGSESVWSVQGYETAIVKDSSDDTWYCETEGEYEVGFSDGDTESLIEFEVNSLSSGLHEVLSDTESELAEVLSAEILVCQDDSDQEFWADSSSNEQYGSSDSDPEITDGDKWKCRHCSALNRPLIRFCQKCWQLRNGWLPERRRPKRRHKRFRRTLSAPDGVPAEDVVKQPKRRSSQSLPDFTVDEELRICTSILSKDECGGSQDSVPSTSGTISPSATQLCNICLTRPKNASIVHGRTGHVMCCYGCGMKLWERKGTCPVCRRTIQKVIQNFVV